MSQRILVAIFSLFALIGASDTFCVEVSAQSLALQQSRADAQNMPSEPERSMFIQGQNLYKQGRYTQAAAVLQNLLRLYPKSSIADITLLWLGRSYIQLGNFGEAEKIAGRLHALKDSPFVEMFVGELRESHRQKSPSKSFQNASNAEKPQPKPAPAPTAPNPLASTFASGKSDTPKPASKPQTFFKPTPNPTPKSTPPTSALNTTPTLVIRRNEIANSKPNAISNASSTTKRKSPSPPKLKEISPSTATPKTISNSLASAAPKTLAPHVRIEQVNQLNATGAAFVYRLILTNDGAAMAKDIIISERLPDYLQFVSSEPFLKTENTSSGAQRFIWRVAELAPHKSVALKIKVRLKAGLSNERALSYQDANGKLYP